MYLQAMRITKDILGENHPDYATTLNDLASLYKTTDIVTKPNRCFWGFENLQRNSG
ncbi:MAG: tetratricopeptide repeat protein [Ignavibacteria bacterium]|nr:tetratricopeptide repeat protein [Ignavibacteria bacterium]